MTRLLARLHCYLTGHAATVWIWDVWRNDPEVGRRRVFTETCTRCDGVLGIRQERERAS